MFTMLCNQAKVFLQCKRAYISTKTTYTYMSPRGYSPQNQQKPWAACYSLVTLKLNMTSPLKSTYICLLETGNEQNNCLQLYAMKSRNKSYAILEFKPKSTLMDTKNNSNNNQTKSPHWSSPKVQQKTTMTVSEPRRGSNAPPQTTLLFLWLHSG